MNVHHESVPLQGGSMHYPNMAQSTVVQYTNVNVGREMPKDYFIWSLCCFLYSNPCCMGLAALINSVKARDKKVVGDIEGARAYAFTARTLNIISTVLVSLSVLIAFIVLTVVLLKTASNVIHPYDENYNYGGRYSYNG